MEAVWKVLAFLLDMVVLYSDCRDDSTHWVDDNLSGTFRSIKRVATVSEFDGQQVAVSS